MEVEGLHLGLTKGEVTRQQGGSRLVIDFTLVSNCYGHEGTNYITRPWASDEDNIRTIKRAIPTLALGQVSTIRRTTTDLD